MYEPRVSSPLKDYSSLRPLWVITIAHTLFNFSTKTLMNIDGLIVLLTQFLQL